MRPNTELATAIIKAKRTLFERLAETLDPQLPAVMMSASERLIDDGCDYDRGYDPRPEIVKQDDAALRRRSETGA